VYFVSTYSARLEIRLLQLLEAIWADKAVASCEYSDEAAASQLQSLFGEVVAGPSSLGRQQQLHQLQEAVAGRARACLGRASFARDAYEAPALLANLRKLRGFVGAPGQRTAGLALALPNVKRLVVVDTVAGVIEPVMGGQGQGQGSRSATGAATAAALAQHNAVTAEIGRELHRIAVDGRCAVLVGFTESA
jgi:hypothetical protein